MTKHYNKIKYKGSRKYLRNHPTYTGYLLWMRLKSKRMCGYKFRRQYSVDRYILDFYCPKLKLAIEVDGISHESQKQRDYDYKRQFYIEGFGITFIRISDEEILSNLDTVVKKIKFQINEIENFFRKTSPIPPP